MRISPAVLKFANFRTIPEIIIIHISVTYSLLRMRVFLWLHHKDKIPLDLIFDKSVINDLLHGSYRQERQPFKGTKQVITCTLLTANDSKL